MEKSKSKKSKYVVFCFIMVAIIISGMIFLVNFLISSNKPEQLIKNGNYKVWQFDVNGYEKASPVDSAQIKQLIDMNWEETEMQITEPDEKSQKVTMNLIKKGKIDISIDFLKINDETFAVLKKGDLKRQYKVDQKAFDVCVGARFAAEQFTTSLFNMYKNIYPIISLEQNFSKLGNYKKYITSILAVSTDIKQKYKEEMVNGKSFYKFDLDFVGKCVGDIFKEEIISNDYQDENMIINAKDKTCSLNSDFFKYIFDNIGFEFNLKTYDYAKAEISFSDSDQFILKYFDDLIIVPIEYSINLQKINATKTNKETYFVTGYSVTESEFNKDNIFKEINKDLSIDYVTKYNLNDICENYDQNKFNIVEKAVYGKVSYVFVYEKSTGNLVKYIKINIIDKNIIEEIEPSKEVKSILKISEPYYPEIIMDFVDNKAKILVMREYEWFELDDKLKIVNKILATINFPSNKENSPFYLETKDYNAKDSIVYFEKRYKDDEKRNNGKQFATEAIIYNLKANSFEKTNALNSYYNRENQTLMCSVFDFNADKFTVSVFGVYMNLLQSYDISSWYEVVYPIKYNNDGSIVSILSRGGNFWISRFDPKTKSEKIIEIKSVVGDRFGDYKVNKNMLYFSTMPRAFDEGTILKADLDFLEGEQSIKVLAKIKCPRYGVVYAYDLLKDVYFDDKSDVVSACRITDKPNSKIMLKFKDTSIE